MFTKPKKRRQIGKGRITRWDSPAPREARCQVQSLVMRHAHFLPYLRQAPGWGSRFRELADQFPQFRGTEADATNQII